MESVTPKSGDKSTKNERLNSGDQTDKAAARAKRKEAKKLGKQNKVKENGPAQAENAKTPVEKNDATVKDPPFKPAVEEKPVNESQPQAEPSKAELRAKRRAIQEAQRLAKVEKAKEAEKAKTEEPKPVKSAKSKASVKPETKVVKSDSLSLVSDSLQKIRLFNHLYFCGNINHSSVIPDIPACIIRLGVQYSSRTVLGSNARCVALLSALKKIIASYKTPAQQEFCRSLEVSLQTYTAHLHKCRPMAVSMTNALKNFKWQLSQMDPSLDEEETRNRLLEGVDTYVREEIDMAGQAISNFVQDKITDGDVILIYGCSSLIKKILLDAHKNQKSFNVIVVDSRPLFEGREMLRKLVCEGISCSYILINSVSFVISRVTKVLLSAHALLANGYVMSRTGTAQVALVAHSSNKPVLVCCETHKFCERVQTDSFVYNEIGDPDELVNTCATQDPLKNWKNKSNITPLNLMYDVTPADLITAVVTELAILPCTSVPVVLRVKPTELVS